ncbi:MAG: hypothetical protein R3A80_13255 [Bdellovibrionota bacterium]
MNKYQLIFSVLFVSFFSAAEACYIPPQKIATTGLWASATGVSVGAPGQEGSELITKSQVVTTKAGTRSEEKYAVVFVSEEKVPMIRQSENEDLQVKKLIFNSVAIVRLRTGASLSISKVLDLNGPVARALGNFEDLDEGLQFGKDYVQGFCSMKEKEAVEE